MIDLNRTIKFFCRLFDLQINEIKEHTLNNQYCISDGDNMVYVTIYTNKNVLVQGKDSELKQLFLCWANKKHSIFLSESSCGHVLFSLEWREWNDDARILRTFFQSHKGKEIAIPDDLLFNRDRMFHDFMFRNKSFCTIARSKCIELVKSWFDKNCFQNIPENDFFNDFHNYIASLLISNKEELELDVIGEALSHAMANHCTKKMIRYKKCYGCPQMGTSNTSCLFNLVDSLYPYTNANQVVAFNQSNFRTLVEGKQENIKWLDITPSTPIEEIMELKLKDANFPIIPQFQAYSNIHKYRIDFLLETNSLYKIGIECDGLEFHSKEIQYINDRKRDRYLQEHNIYMMRFSSVEIFKNIDECIKEIDRQFWKIKKDTFDIKVPYKTSYFHLD